MRFLGYTLGDPSRSDAAAQPRSYDRDGQVHRGGDQGRRAAGHRRPRARWTRPPRWSRTDGKFTVVDGPFTEAKELIGGWALMECRDKAEAIEWTKRFLAIAGDGEIDDPPGLLP